MVRYLIFEYYERSRLCVNDLLAVNCKLVELLPIGNLHYAFVMFYSYLQAVERPRLICLWFAAPKHSGSSIFSVKLCNLIILSSFFFNLAYPNFVSALSIYSARSTTVNYKTS